MLFISDAKADSRSIFIARGKRLEADGSFVGIVPETVNRG